MFGLRLLALCSVCLATAALGYIEQQQWWTLRLSISWLLNGWLLLAVTLAATIQLAGDIATSYDHTLLPTRATLGTIVIGVSFLIFRLLLPLAQNSDYLHLRWKAWTGPSRTGIAPSVTRYLGDVRDWQSLASVCQGMELHPVETSLNWAGHFTGGIPYDPTELLTARLKMDEESGGVWVPRSPSKVGVYAPAEAGHSVSLLWGEELGFMRRCSRGIVAVPRPLLTFHPKLKNGVDGRPLCLAHGILARNKGLAPYRLACNLQTPSRLRSFEENSSLWPRPAKALRSFYNAELSKAFSGLGGTFVCAATELALLLADAKPAIVADWLDAHLEQQDLLLNNRAAALGASPDDLAQLYRGQYITMLVSLSEHKAGIRTRPEITVFRALCAAEGRRDLPAWLNEPTMMERALAETHHLGARGLRLVEAAV
ncbi:hypothetical protein A1O1_02577 [Capronia coronata CBS 617.96]|uniref:Uncharacterized protein n=1 Tax=Capronia coronata CBS 617.96 TaxID=1182541 RepID=W9ZI45_9EURO|nr:uncharacterized protein A1O1_02577 [Capronia coronata CBS 617.96]EXJ94184.1 hypothetical protein A1O1_02577 [Capronia coronata CBS 617.96]